MKTRFVPVTVAALWLAALGILGPAGQAAAADRRSNQAADSPYAMPGTISGSSSTSGQANYQADYHADYRAKGTNDGTEDSTAKRPERRDDSRDQPRDWRNAPGTDRYGRGPNGWPR
jgi:hypothetical protein